MLKCINIEWVPLIRELSFTAVV